MRRRTVLRYLGMSGGAISLGKSARRLLASTDPSEHRVLSLNQCGYLPGSEKIATLELEDAADRAFRLVSERDGSTAYEGRVTASVNDVHSGSQVSCADFSAWTAPGTYRFVAGGVSSLPFVVSKDVYLAPLALSIRSYYGQRCGCAVDLGDGYQHPACHAAGSFHSSSGRSGQVTNRGGWHDAGDYGRYIVNSSTTTATLLWAWELYPRILSALALRIPESGGKVPDYLSEVRWSLEWMLSLQDEDGGVWHKQTSEQFCGMVMPEDDHLTSYVIGTGKAPYKSTCATASFAAVMSMAFRAYGAYDADFSNRCLKAASRAWHWAVSHPNVAFANPSGIGTGAYDDAHCGDEVLWASAELWRSTGEAQYEHAFLEQSKAWPLESSIAPPSWDHVASLGYWAYAVADRKSNDKAGTALRERILAQTETAAQKLLGRRRANGYGNTLATDDFKWGSNSLAANQSLLLLVAHYLNPDKEKYEAALGNLHYLLGRNCFGVSWVTQVGTNSFAHPHHRPSVADRMPLPWPGLLSGGPNAKPEDPIANQLGDLPPMRMWVDHAAAYSLNEVAINWNAALVFLLAAANTA